MYIFKLIFPQNFSLLQINLNTCRQSNSYFNLISVFTLPYLRISKIASNSQSDLNLVIRGNMISRLLALFIFVIISFITSGNGVRLKNRSSGYCLDLDGNRVVMKFCTVTAIYQDWTIRGDGTILNRGRTGSCLHSYGGSVWAFTCDGPAAQKWEGLLSRKNLGVGKCLASGGGDYVIPQDCVATYSWQKWDAI